MRTFKTYLLEYLTNEQRDRYSHVEMEPEAREATDHFFGKGNDHVRHDIEMAHDKSEVHKEVERHLGKEVSHEDYRTGKTKDKYGRDSSIGKMIKDDRLRDRYSKDRSNHAVENHHYSTTVRGVEVAGQTNGAKTKEQPGGHSWANSSCKNVDTGSNKHYLEHEIKHGTVVTRVHDHTGQEIYRATLQPHLNEKGERIYALNSEYGLKHPDFTKHAHKIADELNSKEKEHKGSMLYNIHHAVYNDMQPKQILRKTGVTPEKLDELVKSKNTDDILKSMALSHPMVSKKTLHDHIHEKGNNDQRHLYAFDSVLESPNLDDSHIRAIHAVSKNMHHKNYYEKKIALHDKTSPEHLKELGSSDSTDTRINVAKNKNTDEETSLKLAHDEEEGVRRALFSSENKHIRGYHVKQAMERGDHFAIAHPAFTKEDLTDHIKNNSTQKISHHIFDNPNLDHTHLNSIIDELEKREEPEGNDDQKIYAIAKHKKANPKILNRIIDFGSNEHIGTAMKNPKFSDSNVLHLLDKDHESRVYDALTSQEMERLITPRVLSRIVNSADTRDVLKSYAIKHKNFTGDIVDKHIDHIVNNVDKEKVPQYLNRLANYGHDNLNSDHHDRIYDAASDDLSKSDVLTKIFSRYNRGNEKNVSDKLLHSALEHPNEDVVSSALSNKNIKPEHLEKAFDKFYRGNHHPSMDKSDVKEIGRTVIRHPMLPHHLIDEILDKDPGKRNIDKMGVSSRTDLTSGHIHKLLDLKDANIVDRLLDNVPSKLNSNHIEKMIRTPDMGDYNKKKVIREGKLKLSTARELIGDDNTSEGVKYAAIKYTEGLNDKDIEPILKNENPTLYAAMLNNKNISRHITKEHLARMISHTANINDSITANERLAEIARHREFDSDLIHHAIDKFTGEKGAHVRKKLMHLPHYNKSHTDRLVKDEDGHLKSIIAHYDDNVDSNILHELLKDKDKEVRSSAVSSPKATSEHVMKALDDPESSVRQSAISSRKFGKEHVEKVMNHPDLNTKYLGLHKAFLDGHLTQDQIDQMLNHPDREIRELAQRHLNGDFK